MSSVAEGRTFKFKVVNLKSEVFVAWALCKDVFWQKSGSGVLITNGDTILRLDEPGASAFYALLGAHHSDMASENLRYVQSELHSAGMIWETDVCHNYFSHELAHMKAAPSDI
jgi:hypothetical protein